MIWSSYSYLLAILYFPLWPFCSVQGLVQDHMLGWISCLFRLILFWNGSSAPLSSPELDSPGEYGVDICRVAPGLNPEDVFGQVHPEVRLWVAQHIARHLVSWGQVSTSHPSSHWRLQAEPVLMVMLQSCGSRSPSPLPFINSPSTAGKSFSFPLVHLFLYFCIGMISWILALFYGL